MSNVNRKRLLEILCGFIILPIVLCCDPNVEINTVDPSLLPVLTTNKVTYITSTTAQCGGDLTSDGGSTILMRGVCWSNSNPNPIITDNKTDDGVTVGPFSSQIEGLKKDTKYYVRAYATNTKGTAYGNTISFNTGIVFNQNLNYDSVTDIDGNIYKTIIIGNQIWMAENLRTTHYQNAESIPEISEDLVWLSLKSGAQCSWNNNASFSSRFGRIYNFYAVSDSRNIAPVGWRVATNSDWSILISYLVNNGFNYDGSITDNKTSKAIASTTDWFIDENFIGSPGCDLSKNNKSGFSALPCNGRSDYDGAFFTDGYNQSVAWWTSTLYSTKYPYFYSIAYTNVFIAQSFGYPSLNSGLYVRCVKN